MSIEQDHLTVSLSSSGETGFYQIVRVADDFYNSFEPAEGVILLFFWRVLLFRVAERNDSHYPTPPFVIIIDLPVLLISSMIFRHFALNSPAAIC